MTPLQAELLHHHRRLIVGLEEQIGLLESGAVRFLRGNEDATSEALDRAREQRDELQALVNKHDPEGFTVLR